MPEEPTEKFTTRLKKFVASHKTVLTVTTTVIATTMVVRGAQMGALKEAYDFIEGAGLTEKFMDSVPYDEIYT